MFEKILQVKFWERNNASRTRSETRYTNFVPWPLKYNRKIFYCSDLQLSAYLLRTLMQFSQMETRSDNIQNHIQDIESNIILIDMLSTRLQVRHSRLKNIHNLRKFSKIPCYFPNTYVRLIIADKASTIRLV